MNDKIKLIYLLHYRFGCRVSCEDFDILCTGGDAEWMINLSQNSYTIRSKDVFSSTGFSWYSVAEWLNFLKS